MFYNRIILFPVGNKYGGIMIVNDLLNEVCQLEGVEAIAIGGSRASGYADQASDYDVYVYYTNPISPKDRLPILKKYCKTIELNNTFWETEDNCILLDDIPIDIIYREWTSFEQGLENVVFKGYASNGYTTCLWHNLLTSTIYYDKKEQLLKLKERFNVSYPEQLRNNIIQKNMALLSGYLPSYEDQIKKAVHRQDRVSILHRTTEFLCSYFDVLFAVNKKTHPGEKRLISICKKECRQLPNDFELNLNHLFDVMFSDSNAFLVTLKKIIVEIQKLTK